MSGAHSAPRARRVRSADERWRHAWGAFVFGAIAVIALSLIAFVLTTQHSPVPNAGPPMLLTEVPTQSAHPSTSAHLARSAHRTRTTSRPASSAGTSTAPSSTSARPAPTDVATRSTVPPLPRTDPGRPCRTSAPCVVGGTGQVSAALATYRRSHGQAGVPVAVNSAAQQCAVTGGDGHSCGDPFAVAREPQPDGRAAIRDIGTGTGNFLLDPGLQAVGIGWAFDPATGDYVCVLIAHS